MIVIDTVTLNFWPGFANKLTNSCPNFFRYPGLYNHVSFVSLLIIVDWIWLCSSPNGLVQIPPTQWHLRLHGLPGRYESWDCRNHLDRPVVWGSRSTSDAHFVRPQVHRQTIHLDWRRYDYQKTIFINRITTYSFTSYQAMHFKLLSFFIRRVIECTS